MKLLVGCLSFIGVIAILCVLVLGMAYVMLSLDPPLKSQMMPVSMSSEAAQSLNNKVKVFQSQVEEAVKANEARPVTLVITQEEANSRLIEALAEETVPIKDKDMLLNFRESRVLGYGRFDTPILGAKVAVLASVEIVNGKPKIVAQDIDLGKLPVPGPIANTAASWILRAFSELITVPGDLPWQATSILVEDGKITVRGMTLKAQ